MNYAARISERDLIPHALGLLDQPGHRENGLSVSELDGLLRENLAPTGEDLAWLEGRYDDRFSQKVRNLRSHRTLEKGGLAMFVHDGGAGRFFITEAGRAYLRSGAAAAGTAVQLALDLR